MNAYSILHNYDNQPLYSPDFDLIQQGLAFKQQKLDTNRAQLQNLYDQFSVLKVNKVVDQEYIEDRLRQVRDISNKYASRDLSDDSLMSSLASNITQVLDDKVKNAVYSTKIMNFEDTQWEKMKQDKPELYSDLNREYALRMSDRERYMSSEITGDKYRGGAGFIEYRDLSKKLMENIPKLQDMLKAKWVETGPQQGYFRSVDTYEAIDQNKMNDAIDLLFDEKDRQQLQINGWGTYRDIPDDLLKADYENFFSPQLSEAENKIESLEKLKTDPEWRGRSAEIDQEIAVWKKKQQEIDNFSFDKLYGTYGREGVVQTLYNAKYKSQILDTYAYEPRLVDRKLDEIQAKNVEFQQKLEEADLRSRQWDMDYALRYASEMRLQEKTQLEIEKLKSELPSTTGNGNSRAGDFTKTGTVVEPYARESQSNVAYFEQQQDESIKDAKQLLSNVTGFNLTNKEFQDISYKLQPGKVDPTEKVKVTIRGEQYEIDMGKHYDTFLNLYNNVTNNSPEKEAYYSNYKSGIWNTISDYGVLAVRGNGNLYGNLPQANVQIVKNKKGQLELVKTNNKDYYYELLRKKGFHDANPNKYSALTPVEQKNLEMYTSFSLVMDPELEERFKKGNYRYGVDKALKGVKTNGLVPSYNSLLSVKGSSGEVGYLTDATLQADLRNKKLLLPGTNGQYAKNPKFVAQKIKQINELDNIKKFRRLTAEEEAKRTSYVKSLYNPTGSYVAKADWLPGDMGYYDTNYTTSQGVNTDLGNMDTRLNRRFQAITEKTEQMLLPFVAEKMTSKMSVSPGTAGHAELTKLISTQNDLPLNNKKTLTIERVRDENGVENPDLVKYSYFTTVKGENQEVTGEIDAKYLKERGIFFDPAVRSPYRAELGNLAAKIPLGNSYVEPQKRELYKKIKNTDLPLDNISKVVQTLNERGEPGKAQLINQVITDYKQGKYVFNIEPVSEGGEATYFKTIRKINNSGQSEIIFYDENLGNTIKTSDVKKLAAESIYNNELTFAEYLKQIISE